MAAAPTPDEPAQPVAPPPPPPDVASMPPRPSNPAPPIAGPTPDQAPAQPLTQEQQIDAIRKRIEARRAQARAEEMQEISGQK